MEHIGGKIVLANGSSVPVSKAVKEKGFIFVSGQLAYDENGAIVGGDVATQTKIVLQNIDRILKEAGSDLSRVVKCTCWLTDKNHFSEFNKIYASFFPQNPPARSTVSSGLMVEGALVEIEVIASQD
jgi:2-iminobutanoate/2-iminopropanoate deaminase